MREIFIIECILSVKLKSRLFLDIFLFSFTVKNSFSKFVHTSVTQPLYTEFIIAKLIESFRALKFPRYCLLILLVKVGWREGKALGSAEGKAMECVDRICSRGA
jgi:hypothetical protein